MAWFEGSATDYKDLLAQLKEYATNDNVQSVASIDAGGTGFAIGDLVSVSGGTSTTTSVLEVVAVSAGVVTEIRVFHGGAYSVLPSTTQTGLTSAGGGAGLNVTLTTQAAGWIARVDRSVFRPITVAVNAGGTGYAATDVVTLDDGGAVELRPTLITVDAVSGGVATTISLAQLGIYESIPGTTGVVTSHAIGSGLTVDLTWNEEEELILEGSGSGADEIFVGIRTFSNLFGSTYFNWELAGMQGFNTGQWSGQPSMSRGRYDDDANIGGCFVPLRNVSFNYWMSITSNRIMVFALVGTNVASCFLGFIDPTSTPGLSAGLFPYPLLVAGCTTDPFNVATESTLTSFSGFHDPVAIGAISGSGFRSEYSCCQLNSPGNAWLDFRNSVTGIATDGGVSRFEVSDRTIFPLGGETVLVSGDDVWPTNPQVVAREDFVTQTLSAPSQSLIPTPGASGDEYLLVPLTMTSFFAPEFIAGQIPDAYWLNATGAIADNGSIVNAGGDRYRVFQSGRYSGSSQWLAVLEG